MAVRSRARAVCGLLAAVVLIPSAVAAPPAERAIAAFVRAPTPANLSEAVAALEKRWDLSTRAGRSKFARALRFIPAWEPAEQGATEIMVDLPGGGNRSVVVVLPPDYNPRRSYPLLYILHGSGGDGRNIIRWAEQAVGERLRRFIVAAPNHYGEVSFVRERQPLGEHAAIWAALRERYHVDPAAVHVLGYSKGGYAAFVIGLSYPDHLASVTALACAYSPPTFPGLWEATIGNLAHVPTLHIWGSADTLAVGEWSIAPTIVAASRAFRKFVEKQDVPVTCVELPGVGHNTVRPDRARLFRHWLNERPAAPETVRVTFAHLERGRAYWLQAAAWDEPARKAAREQRAVAPDFAGMKPDARAAVEFVAALGSLRGTRAGNTLEVTSTNLAAINVYLFSETVDWDRPVRVVWNGETVWEGKLEREPALCLEYFAQTRDHTRLLWAGLRLEEGGARPLRIADLPRASNK